LDSRARSSHWIMALRMIMLQCKSSCFRPALFDFRGANLRVS
jgi:hypothetical protein